MPAGPEASASASKSAPEGFLCPISHEIMSEPVFAADGHSYEKSAIEQWFATGKRSSPMTNKAVASTALTPNRHLKSQISEWQSRSSAQRVGELITAVMTAAGVTTSDPKAVEGKLLVLARFVGQHKAVVQPKTLQMFRVMLQVDAQLWVAPVQQALQVAEAECKLIVTGLATKLRDERRDEALASAAVAAARSKLVQLDIEIVAAEEALGTLKRERAKQAQDVAALERVETDCRSCAAQVEQDLNGYPEPLLLLDGGEEGEPGGGASERQTRKRKQVDEEGRPGTEVAQKRQRGDGGTGCSADVESAVLMREGLEWVRGSRFRVQDTVRGKLLIEAAAAGGLPLAVVTCRMIWGDHHDKQAAVESFRELASVQEGAKWIVLEAQLNLGDCYQNGYGVQKDKAEGVKWYRKAAEQGHSVAQCKLGVCYRNGRGVQKDEVEAVKWYRKAAEQGYSEALNLLGFCYQKGVGVEKDEAEAVKWYRKSVEQGHSVALNYLGFCYQKGVGVEKEEAEAVKWYRRAAEQGYSQALLNLGFCYQKGVGVEKDEAEAVKCYRKAAEQGFSAAQFNLGFCYQNGYGVEKDEAEGVKWYRRAAEQGVSGAQSNLGVCYEMGSGVQKDEAEAVKWYRKAAEQGVSGAQTSLGFCYQKGVGVEKDEAEAVKWYRKAAEQRCAHSIRAMARCYREGIGVEKDDAEARRWQQQHRHLCRGRS
jgi:TPR repeat protein